MNKIRTLGQLSDELDNDLSSRKRALTTLKFSVQGARKHEREPLGFAATCLLYGHWEGFIKFAATCYTNHVFSLGYTYSQLSNPILAICLRSHIRSLRDTRKISAHRDFLSLVRDQGMEVARIPWKAAIETYDNLNTEVLVEILAIIGCSGSPYLSQKAVIDEKLLRHRNAIAHSGKSPEFNIDDYSSLHDSIVLLIERFRDDVENAAMHRLYARTPLVSL